MSHIKHLTCSLSNVNILVYFILLACSVFCLPKCSDYIPPTYSTEKPRPRIPGELYPRMIIMYMDRTIWPFWFELDVTRPIKKKNDIVLDDGFQPLKPFQQVPGLLNTLHNQGYKLAFINQSPDNQSMDQLLEWFDFNKYLTHKMSMHAPKKELVRIISQKYNISFGDLLYLDSEYDEMPDVASLQTVCIQCSDKGVTMKDVEKGLHIFSTAAPDYDIIPVDVNNLEAIENTSLRCKALPLQFPLTNEDRRDIRTLSMKFQMDHDIAKLSAPQIGISKRIIIFSVALRKDEIFQYRLWINPSYEKVNDEMTRTYEGCASVKSMTGKVKRYKTVRYKAFDMDGKLVEGVEKGYPARVIQHEVDHLDGILYVDHVPKGKVITLQKHMDRINKFLNQGLPMIPVIKKKK